MQRKDEAIQFLNLALDDSYVCHTLFQDPNASQRIICFHAQQAVEKGLKAILVSQNIVPLKTHDLTELAYMLEDAGIVLPIPIANLAYLTPYAVTIRYGGEVKGAMNPEEACELMDTILQFVQTQLSSHLHSTSEGHQ